jgi:hypothetical protein
MELGPQPPRPKPKTDSFFFFNPKKRPPKCHQHIWNNKVHKQTKEHAKRDKQDAWTKIERKRNLDATRERWRKRKEKSKNQETCMDKERKRKKFRNDD